MVAAQVSNCPSLMTDSLIIIYPKSPVTGGDGRQRENEGDETEYLDYYCR